MYCGQKSCLKIWRQKLSKVKVWKPQKLAFTIKGHNSRTIKGILTKFEFDLCIVVKETLSKYFKWFALGEIKILNKNLRIGISQQIKGCCSRTEFFFKCPKSDLAHYTWWGIKTNNILGVLVIIFILKSFLLIDWLVFNVQHF